MNLQVYTKTAQEKKGDNNTSSYVCYMDWTNKLRKEIPIQEENNPIDRSWWHDTVNSSAISTQASESQITKSKSHRNLHNSML